MPFPSGRCRTCRARHVKCDENRPICKPCRTARRACTWHDDDKSDRLFRSENSFASNAAQRLRGGARRTGLEPGDLAAKSPNPIKTQCLQAPECSMNKNAITPPEFHHASPNNYQPWEDLIEHARNKTYHAWLASDGEISSEVWGFLYHYQSDFLAPATHTCPLVGLAFDGFALTRYALSSGYMRAEVVGLSRYAQALSRLREALDASSAGALLDDSLVVATLVLSSFENSIGDSTARSPTPHRQGYAHIRGVSSLLKLRGQQQKRSDRAVMIDRVAAARIVRQALYHGDAVEKIIKSLLSNDAMPQQASLDQLISDVVNLTSRARGMMSKPSDTDSVEPARKRQGMMELTWQAARLDRLLEEWHTNLPLDWSHEHRELCQATVADPSVDSSISANTIGDYSACGTGTVVFLNRYRAARLLCHGIASRFFDPTRSTSMPIEAREVAADQASALVDINTSMENSRRIMSALVDEIFQSVPLVLGGPEASSVAQNSPVAPGSAARAVQLIWPLVIVVEILPPSMRLEQHIAKTILGTISDLTGNTSLRATASP